jgi:hypothetical protein
MSDEVLERLGVLSLMISIVNPPKESDVNNIKESSAILLAVWTLEVCHSNRGMFFSHSRQRYRMIECLNVTKKQ